MDFSHLSKGPTKKYQNQFKCEPYLKYFPSLTLVSDNYNSELKPLSIFSLKGTDSNLVYNICLMLPQGYYTNSVWHATSLNQEECQTQLKRTVRLQSVFLVYASFWVG